MKKTEAKYHHLTPRVYMKAWRHNPDKESKKAKVYIVDKQINGMPKSKSTKKFAGIDDYHTIKAGFVIAEEKECELFFRPLAKYNIFYSKNNVSNPKELNNIFRFFEDWIIKDGDRIISEEEKADLKSQISQIHVKTIEIEWNDKYEIDWDQIRKSIVDNLPEDVSVDSIPAIAREKFIRFMVSLEWRGSSFHPLVQDILNVLPQFRDLLEPVIIPEEDRLFPFLKTMYDELLHNYRLKAYKAFLQEKGNIWLETELYINQGHIRFMIAPEDAEFLTSDNPVCRVTDVEGRIHYLFPVTPKILCTVRINGPLDTYSISHITKDEVIRYNHELKANADKVYFMKEQDLQLYFG